MRTIEWNFEKKCIQAVDQTKIPYSYEIMDINTVDEAIDAIYALAVRGAPAIGTCGAMALALYCKNLPEQTAEAFYAGLDSEAARIVATRPTAVNLKWAVEKSVSEIKAADFDNTKDIFNKLVSIANGIADKEVENAKRIGEFGATLIPETGANIHTHCSTGPLCTVDYGLGMGVVYTAMKQGKPVHVYTDETRPRMQGTKINTFDLKRMGVPYTLICDDTSALLMKLGKIDMVFISADRVVGNGDVAAKIGVYGIAICAKEHGIPVYCFAPTSTIDYNLKSGDDIKLEQRPADEVLNICGTYVAPPDTPVQNYAFDVTPAKYWTAIITEKGIAYPPFSESLLKFKD